MAALAKPDERLEPGLNLRLGPDMRQRIRRVGMVRQTREAPTARWLLTKGLEWWEGLSREERESL